MSDTKEPVVRQENDTDVIPYQGRGLGGRRTKRIIELLSGVGFAATAAGFVTDFSLSDVLALAGGLATLGVVSAGSAALSVLLRRRSLSAKVEELEDLKQKITGDEYAEISGEALVKMIEIIEARMQEQERRMTRMGWRQGAVYAIFATAVAVLLVVFSHWVPVVR